MQQGVPQLAIVAYDPRVLARLGLPAMEGGLRAQQRFFQSSVPTIRGSERTAAGLLAVVSVQPRSVAPDQTFLFRRVGRTWVILFDTVLEQGLDAYARVSTPFQGTKAKTERLAAARAAALAERYRLLTAPRSAARP
jgi:hypothetical protein